MYSSLVSTNRTHSDIQKSSKEIKYYQWPRNSLFPLLVRKELILFYFIQMKLCRMCVFYINIQLLWLNFLPVRVIHIAAYGCSPFLLLWSITLPECAMINVYIPLWLGIWVASNMLLLEYCWHKHSNTFLFWKHVDISLGLLDHNTRNM